MILHYYAKTKPCFIKTISQTRWTDPIRPYFFDGRVTGKIHLNSLQNELQRLVGHLPKYIMEKM